MTKRFLGSVAVLTALASSSGTSWAQVPGQSPGWLQDRKLQEGAGIRVGDLELHPGIGAEGGYDSNFFLRSHNSPPAGGVLSNGTPNKNVIGAGTLRVTPSFAVSTLGPQRMSDTGGPKEDPAISFRANLAATYMEFFGDQEIRDQRNVSASTRAQLNILPGRPWGSMIYAGYNRIVQPNASANPDLSWTRNQVNGGAEIIATPGGGTLDIRLGYNLFTELYEDRLSKNYSSMQHQGALKGRWRFTPRTSLLSDTTFGFYTYPNLKGPSVLSDSTPLRTRFGFDGLVTSRVGFTALVGYGASFLDSKLSRTQQYNSIIGTAKVTFYLSANPTMEDSPAAVSTFLSTITAGYHRDFQPSILSNYYGIDRGELAFNAFIAGRAAVALSGGLSGISYPDILAPVGTVRKSSFTDLRLDTQLFSEYRISDSFGINTTIRYTTNISDTQLLETSATTNSPAIYSDFNWRRFEAFAGVRFFM